jgi:predicted phage-related endonuclease
MEPRKETEAMAAGNKYERYIIMDICQNYSFDEFDVITEPEELWKERGIFACNLDADNPGMEAKFTRDGNGWGDTESQLIPQHFFVQVQFQMLVTGYEQIYVGVWIANFGIDARFYVIKRDEAMIGKIETLATAWWQKYVVTARESIAAGESPRYVPRDEKPVYDTFKRIIPRPGKVVPLSGVLIDKWELAKIQAKHAAQEVDALKSEIHTELGDAEAGELPDGSMYMKRGNGWRVVDADKIGG